MNPIKETNALDALAIGRAQGLTRMEAPVQALLDRGAA